VSRRPCSRRDFTKLATAATVGLAIGTGARAQDSKKALKIEVDPALLIDADPHVCRGLNSCKGKGRGGGNECAGQGSCATAPSITCSTNNACKGKGGCGGYPGQNTCKAKGECAVPLTKEIWTIARKQFEQLMKAQGRKVGKAPLK
jgi:hypothetical protein